MMHVNNFILHNYVCFLYACIMLDFVTCSFMVTFIFLVLIFIFMVIFSSQYSSFLFKEKVQRYFTKVFHVLAEFFLEN